eukprot:Sdes_comp15569_c0_seq1m4543
MASITRTSFGPNGMNKMVINHLEKLFVTSDASTIIRELEVQHPAAKLIVLGSQMQEQEIGDGSNFVIIFAGELLSQAESLINMGLHPSDIIEGYEKASVKALEILETLCCHKLTSILDKSAVVEAIKSSIASKQYGYEDFLTNLIVDACLSSLPKNPKNFNVDNIRVAKVLGS